MEQAKALVSFVVSAAKYFGIPIGGVLIQALAYIVNITEYSKHFLFSVFIIIMFLPEIALLTNRSFRGWLRSGIEDGDGKLQKDDVSQMIVHYSTLWCTRLYVFFGLVEVFYNVKVSEIFVVGSIAGAFGIEGISLLGRRFEKKH